MGFKLPGKSITSGTAGHSSALKMKAEADAASALKQTEERETSWWRGEEGFIPDELQPNVNRPKVKVEQEGNVEVEETPENNEKAKTTKHGTKTYDEAYKNVDKEKYKTQEEFNTAADDWWKTEAGQKKASAKGSKFAHRITKKEPTTQMQNVEKRAANKVEKIEKKSAKKVAEVGENLTKKGAKINRKDARKEFGRGSKEHLKAKQAHLVAKEADRQGEEGGKKQSIFRRLSSKINKKRQAKNQAKIDANKAE
jgi:hypothetical protein